VAVQKGTTTHLAGSKILEKFGLSEKDVKIVNMDVVNAQLALITHDIDAAIGTTDYLRLRDQGAARIVYATAGDPITTSNGSIVASQSFLDKYPTTATRVLKVFVRAAQWLAETNPTQVFQLWTKSGTTFASFREDWKGDDVKYRTSPLLDSYLASRYKAQISEAKRFNLIKSTFSYEEWAEPKFLERALKELGLESYWQPRGPDGKPSQPDTRRAASLQPKAATPEGG
jgi:sulfonate transport system substrate-binding protein